MAYDKDQREFPLPGGSDDRRRSSRHLPRYFRTQVNNKFLSSTVDQLIQPGVTEKLNGYIGRKAAPGYSADDFYIEDINKQRNDYQLEPVAVVKDDLDNVQFYGDYNDYINQIKNLDGSVEDHSVLNQQEYYSWNPHIDWDKFVNFREYYWLPNGPQSIPVSGDDIQIQSTYTVTSQDNLDNYAFVFSPDGLTQNPELTLYRGTTYRFEIDSPGVPLSFRSNRLTAPPWTAGTYFTEGESVLYERQIYVATGSHRSGATLEEDRDLWTLNTTLNLTNEASDQGVENGVIELNLTPETPDFIYYVSDADVNAGGLIRVYDEEEASFIDVDKEIVGKKNYTTGEGFDLSNGMKIYFQGTTEQEKYQQGSWYVEGVGTEIQLIPEDELNIASDFIEDEQIDFDTEGFDTVPYSRAIGFPREKDYLTINRSSRDGNLWSKYNRWFHRSVIEQSAEINRTELILDQSARAVRPIIEFEPNLKLFEFGTESKQPVDLVDDFTTDVFSTVEGAVGYNVDGVDVTNGMRVLFTADPDIRVAGKIYKVEFILFKGERQIALRETDDTEPLLNETVLCKQGENYRGKILYYIGNEWELAQQKEGVNQPPLFDVFDCNEFSLADEEVYQSSDFTGTKLFSYKIGQGPSDSELGFPLAYRSIQNVGDIVFDFNLTKDAITFCPNDSQTVTETTGIGYLRQFTTREEFVYLNGWQKANNLSRQPVLRQYEAEQGQKRFEIDVYEESALLTDIVVKVFVNNQIQNNPEDYILDVNSTNNSVITFKHGLNQDDIVQIKTRSSAVKNENGLYEIASNLERNPLNEDVTELTLGEVNDHVRTIVEELDEFEGRYPGSSNLRDQGQVSQYGRRILKHSAPLNIALYHLLDDEANLVKALKFARQEYGKFKRNFLQTAFDLSFNGPVDKHFEQVMRQITREKPDTDPFYFSDMAATGGKKSTLFTIDSPDQQFFGLSNPFDLAEPSEKSVLVYLNGTQLVHGSDYTFNSEGFVVLSAGIERDDELVINEFESTNGNFIPATPTKLGLYPKFKPRKFVDNTYLEARTVIQGHDGSIMLAFDDFRDDLILELEKRIYNNLKVAYDTDLFDIYDYLPGEFRDRDLSIEQIDNSMISDFIQWTRLIDDDYTVNSSYDRNNSFTWNYTGSTNRNNNFVNGWWRSVYKSAYDTDRPHTRPWEMLGYFEKPNWWDDQYGEAPYTSNNLLMWEDIENGIVREPGKNFVQLDQYKRPGLLSHLPVDESGNLLSPLDSNYIKDYNPTTMNQDFVYGDWSPVETAWRRSSEYPFALLTSLFLNQPNRTMSVCFDRTRQKRGLVNDIIYQQPNRQIRTKDIIFPNSIRDDERVFSAGFVNYIRDYISSSVSSIYDEYKLNLQNINNQIGAKLAGFSTKDKLNLILDSRTPLNEGNVFVPEENYKIFLNTSTPIRTVYYSGVIVEKQTNGFAIRGYNENQPFFIYTPPRKRNKDPVINVGGISASAADWESNKTLISGQIVRFRNSFYRVTVNHVTSNSFEEDNFISLPRLPVEGGREAIVRQEYQPSTEILPYGTVLRTVQDVVDFIQGYGNWLESQGLVFDFYDGDTGLVADWLTAAKEYLFWTTQNWGKGSVISLSPGAFKIKVQSEFSIVDDIYNTFYGYSLLKVDGNKFQPEFVSLTREEPGEFEIKPKNTEDGIFGLRIAFVQKEHALLLDNRTQFNDIIYDQAAGYRQERIRILGYRTTDWDGSINIPGFIFDEVTIEDWQPWKDYAIGDIVRYKEFFYAAIDSVPGSEVFNSRNWRQLSERPESGLIPNFEYKTNQFADFYDLDTDNFDSEQQKFAQHLIGYQNRNYLANIINDDVSQYKFYQGFIQDKGTANAFTKLFDALGSANRDSLEFYEEWAIKTGQYGAADGFEEVEYLLDESKFKASPQPVKLTSSPTTGTELVYRILPKETYQKPRDYNHAPFPSTEVVDTFVKNSGYVNPDDVNFVVDNLIDITDLDINDIEFGSKIWLGNEGNTWNVYTAIRTDLEVDTIETNEDGYDLSFARIDNTLEIGDIIGLYNTEDLDGLYEISNIENNIVSILSDSEEEASSDIIDGRILKFVSSRFTNANGVTENAQLIDQGLNRIWIDQTVDNWRVLDRADGFAQHDIITTDEPTDTLSYASSIDTDTRNTVLVVGDPDNENGKAFVYTRSSSNGEFSLVQTLEITDDISSSASRFGESVAVSQTGDYIAIGSPSASNVKSQFTGDYEEEKDYQTGSIVNFEDSLWQTISDIQGAVGSIEFGSYESAAQILLDLNATEEDSEFIPVLFAGNYPFENQTADHFVVKAPLDMYQGSDVGDSIELKWNTLSYAYQDVEGLQQVEPFKGDIPAIDSDFITQSHIIAEKIDSILYVDASTNIPDVGQIVETQTAFGTVAYTYNEGAQVTIYVKEQNGDFGLQGSLTTSIGEFVGEYETQAPREQTNNAEEYWGGFWKINVSDYSVEEVNDDAGRGLVYTNLVPAGNTDTGSIYYNILDFESDAFSSFDTRNSELTTLTFEGLPGPEGVSGVFPSDLYVLRAPKELTDELSAGDEIEIFYNTMQEFQTGDFKDPETIGLTAEELNRKHEINDLWDGYIDFEITKNLGGVPLEPKVGITVQDVTNDGTAVVTFYQRFDTTKGRIYVKNVQGDWALGNDFGENREIQFLADGSGDPVYDPASGSRVFGQIQSRSLGYTEDGIGQLVVLQTQGEDTIELQETDRILDAEYWFYLEQTVQGIARPANIPAENNNDWTQVYRVPAGVSGEASDFENEGMFTVYERTGSRQWTKISDFVIPQRNDNNRLGAGLKFARINDITKLFVQAGGLPEEENYGKIFVIKNGKENGNEYNWDLGRDKEYKGEFSDERDYFENDVVFYEGKLYRADTNIIAGVFDSNDWKDIDVPLDYLGFIPNDQGLVLDDESSVLSTDDLLQFSRDFDVSKNGEVLVTSSFYSATKPNRLIVYRNLNGLYIKSQEIKTSETTDDFGNSISISDDGRFIAVGAPLNSEISANQGAVFVYKQVDGEFELAQVLSGSNNELNQQFGFRVSFDNDTLAVCSRNGDSVVETTFDNNDTVFDGELTQFKDYTKNTGTIQLYELFDEVFLYAETIDFDDSAVRYFGRNLHVANNHVYVGMPRLSYENSSTGTVVDYKKEANQRLWQELRSIKPTVDVNKIKRVSLYDTRKNELIQYLDYIDPLQGKIAGIAEQEISYKLYYDPAVYTEGTGVQVDKTNSWGKHQVGKIWWDLTNTKFINPYQGDITYSANNWSSLFSEFNSVDVYEWVESNLLPSEWDNLTGTEQGFTRGITGTTRYGNSAYVTKRNYDKASQTFSTRYYYWVRNKSTVPPIEDRNNSAQDIADLIRNPQGEGYRYASLISPTEFALYNCNSLIKDKDIAISFQYWTIDNQTINIHNQYQIVTDGLASSRPKRDIEQKWFDSLVGYDSARREVPAPELSAKEKYGVLNTPRQSWFVNRTEALKEAIDRINRVLGTVLIVDEKDISRLTEQEEQPTKASGTYDRTVEFDIDLEFVGTAKAREAKLSVDVEDGRIVRVNIDDTGRGYLEPPTVNILGTGTGAEITVEIDNQGRVQNAVIASAGEYYQDNTLVSVRPFTVLVENDSTLNGRWALYERQDREWVRVASQGFDVNQYWDYIDWYESGFNKFTEINHLIDASYELQSLDDEIGDIVKIENIGTGGWLLLQKVDEQQTADYTINYRTLGRQNGTIQFKKELYDIEANLSGFDATLFDDVNFDSLPTRETRIILETIRDDIFTDDLSVEYNKLFFSSLRYVLSEQNFIDWAFKTSFIKAQHNVGELRKKISFQNDNLPNYEDYVQEVKPYSTTIREYLSTYEKLEQSRTTITDFDLPPRFDPQTQNIAPIDARIVDDKVVLTDTVINTYPDRHWLDNIGHGVESIAIADTGNNYTSAPVVSIIGGGGTGARAKASLGTGGKVTQIAITDPGQGYLSAPTVQLNGSIDDDGSEAKAIAQIGGSPVRNMHCIMKFDRVSGDFEFVNLQTVEEFAGTGSNRDFDLEWPMDLRTTKVRVIVDGSEALGGRYTYENVLDTSKGYARYQGRIQFSKAPANASTIRVEYNKSINLLNAQDRISAAYEPTTGQLGKSLGQLMEGIDYGGVEVTSVSFGGVSGWGSQPWSVNAWDVFDNSFEDEIFQLDGSTISVELDKPLESGVIYNIYRVALDSEGNIVSNKRMDDPDYGTVNQTNEDAVTESLQGDGSTTIIYLDELDIPTTPEGEEDSVTIIIRKITSDGSVLPDPGSYDTALSGGDLAYQTATGLRPEDINIDGDGFVTPTTSKGPEEVVPGQVLDTVDIKVYETTTGGSSKITARNYIGDGDTRTFEIGATPIKLENLFVKIDNIIQNNDQFTVNYRLNQITFADTPPSDSRISIVNLGDSGSEILDIDNFVGDGETGEFLTNIVWSDDLEAFATVNGQEKPFSLIESTDDYEVSGNVVIKFTTPPAKNSIIHTVILTGGLIDQNYSVVETDQFIADGSTVDFVLENNIFAQQPALAYTLVKVNDRFLNAGYNEKFTVSDQREYQLDITQVPVGSVTSDELEVYLNKEKLEFIQEWSFTGATGFTAGTTQAGSIVVLEPGIGEDGDELEVYVLTDGEYRFGFFDSSNDFIATRGEDSSFPVLHLDSAYSEGDVITVYNFSNHDSQGIERQSLEIKEETPFAEGTTPYFDFKRLQRGVIKLRKPARDSASVWVIQNGTLLSPNIDYYVTLDNTTVNLAKEPNTNDIIEIVHFSNPIVRETYGWRQFKDMLNRTHYKRLSKNYVLAKNLNYNDTVIEVEDANGLPEPDFNTQNPGVIFLDKERIEYFVKDGNQLKQLRRGTLGTGIKQVYAAGTEFMEQGKSHNLPYNDNTEVITFASDETTTAFTTGLDLSNTNEVEVFVAGTRLRKNPIDVFDKTEAQDSPEGDIEKDAEYTVSGSTIHLAVPPQDGSTVTVITKTGSIWSESDKTLADSNTDIAKFLQASTTDLPR